jgi:putative hydrolase of the HAD superfamily
MAGTTYRSAVWTDFGGVITQPIDETFRSFTERYGVPGHALREAMAEVGRAYGTDSMGPLDIPLVDEETWARQVEQVLEHSFGLTCDLSDFGERWFAGRPTNQEWVDYLRVLRERGVFVGMLSNMPPAWERQWRRMVPADSFDAVVCSHSSGSRKPEPAIFAAAQARAGLSAAACLLVDDLAKNCVGAREAGWQAVLFTTTADVISEVDNLLSAAV